MSCLICDRISMIKSGTNPYFVCELETGYVVLGDHQHFHGYSLFLLKEHYTELHFIPQPMRQKHMEELALVYEAVYNAFKPEKMNCELLGMGDAHVHWHLFPRISGDTPQRGPVWWLPREEMWNDSKRPTQAQLENMVNQLRSEVEKLLEC